MSNRAFTGLLRGVSSLCISTLNIFCDTVCVLVYVRQVASESEHCIIKREHEKCMERIMLHNPSDDLELGK